MTPADFLAAVMTERARQDAKFPDCADLPDSDRGESLESLAKTERYMRNRCDKAYAEGRCTFSHIMEEESIEVVHAAARGNTEELQRELVQVAAVCLRWLEAIARRTK